MPQAYFTFAQQIFHIEDISLVPKERISLKKALALQVLFSGGGRWIRTTEGIASRFTVCPLWP
ncbi:MAG: hypothetical protein J6J62_08575, partial [Oscillospiraceae bacterium]|nr:hypothetical protein [Oscillospiraceae bacterium]